MDYTRIKVTLDGKVAIVTLSHPQTLNALGPVMCEELAGALGSLPPQVRAVVLTGEGRAFSSGANLTEAAALFEGGAPDLQALVERYYNPVAERIRTLPVPIVTAAPGVAAGIGCSFALMGDMIVAGEGSSFVLAFSRIGLIPDGGATWLLGRLAGRARAMEMTLLGDAVSGPEALDWGLINRCVPDDRVMDTALGLARRLADGPASLGLARRLIWEGQDAAWAEQLKSEAKAQGEAGRSADFQEGVSAFLEKRPPRFRGR